MPLPLQALPGQATLLDQCSENPFPNNRLRCFLCLMDFPPSVHPPYCFLSTPLKI